MCQPFLLGHGAEVQIEAGKQKYHQKTEQCVKIVWNSRNKGCKFGIKGASGFQIAANGCRPAGNRSDDAHRGGGGIDDVGKLGPADLKTVGNRLHDGTHGQTVEVVIQEDQAAQQTGAQLGGTLGADDSGSPLAVGFGAAGGIDQIHQRAQQEAEQHNVHIRFLEHDIKGGENGTDNGIQTRGNRINNGAGKNTGHQREEYFLGNQGKDDGDEGGQNGQPPNINRFHNISPFLLYSGLLSGMWSPGNQAGERSEAKGKECTDTVCFNLEYSVAVTSTDV